LAGARSQIHPCSYDLGLCYQIVVCLFLR
jgi:hypothetical protein